MVVSPLLNEKEILSRIAQGDQYAFTNLFNHYQRFVYSYGRKLTHSEEMALDLVQEVFIKIWHSRASLLEVEHFIAYLNRLVRNHAFNQLRALSKRSRITGDLELAGLEIEDSTLQLLDYKETLRVVSQAVDLLSPQQKMAYQLCHQQGMKYDEAAAQMGISPGTVHVHMKHALSKIREHLRRNAFLYPAIALVLIK
ncbi:RNA polymerase ECF-type sigma factor [Pedobacter sp. BAL39]|uniref:RNA polymerase sigma factor n=1 Tax=Pedobacter sp. BAL39 TaxID=391596 RepID=UPI0001559B09|nr:RNA polymerase sigma-70 factor [Pedobacter sp. BAL39]EDM36264.1 RNA polymerase ECF-type sigma factor [Pedobacter sp. BAL39]